MAAAGAAYKVLALVGGLGAKKVAGSALDKGWAKTRGGEPPRNPATPGTGWGEAILWAVASGATVGIARLIVVRATAKAWQKSTGNLPPGVEDVGN